MFVCVRGVEGKKKKKIDAMRCRGAAREMDGIIHEKLQRQGPFGFTRTHAHTHEHIYRPADGLVSGVVWWQNG